METLKPSIYKECASCPALDRKIEGTANSYPEAESINIYCFDPARDKTAGSTEMKMGAFANLNASQKNNHSIRIADPNTKYVPCPGLINGSTKLEDLEKKKIILNLKKIFKTTSQTAISYLNQ